MQAIAGIRRKIKARRPRLGLRSARPDRVAADVQPELATAATVVHQPELAAATNDDEVDGDELSPMTRGIRRDLYAGDGGGSSDEEQESFSSA